MSRSHAYYSSAMTNHHHHHPHHHHHHQRHHSSDDSDVGDANHHHHHDEDEALAAAAAAAAAAVDVQDAAAAESSFFKVDDLPDLPEDHPHHHHHHPDGAGGIAPAPHQQRHEEEKKEGDENVNGPSRRIPYTSEGPSRSLKNTTHPPSSLPPPPSSSKNTSKTSATSSGKATKSRTRKRESKKRERRCGRAHLHKQQQQDDMERDAKMAKFHDSSNTEGALTAATTDNILPPSTTHTMPSSSSSWAPAEQAAGLPEVPCPTSTNNNNVVLVPLLAAFRVQSKHEEKWNAMFQKLLEYKEQYHSTNVPQCYSKSPKLGRWVHYQRVEYWIYMSSGKNKGKITPERIQRLEDIGFEWDPQRAKWVEMYTKLKEFHAEHGHCKVPKGYNRDTELANWVRNQRLEYTNKLRNKKSRMTQERLDLLNELGFTWSNPLPSRAQKAARVEERVRAATAVAEQAAGVGPVPTPLGRLSRDIPTMSSIPSPLPISSPGVADATNTTLGRGVNNPTMMGGSGGTPADENGTSPATKDLHSQRMATQRNMFLS